MDPEIWRISAASEATSTSDLWHRKSSCYSPHHNFVINRMTPFYCGFIFHSQLWLIFSTEITDQYWILQSMRVMSVLDSWFGVGKTEMDAIMSCHSWVPEQTLAPSGLRCILCTSKYASVLFKFLPSLGICALHTDESLITVPDSQQSQFCHL